MAEVNLYRGKKFFASISLSLLAIAALIVVIISQIIGLKKSGDQAVEAINETKLISEILINLNILEKSLNSNTLTLRLLDSLEESNQTHIKKLNEFEPQLQPFLNNHNKIYNTVKESLKDNTTKKDKAVFDFLFLEGRRLKTNLLKENLKIVNTTYETFSYENKWFPYIFLASTIIGLVILLSAIYFIFESRKIIVEKSDILDAILENTNDIVYFFEPVFDKDENLIDFSVTYASKTNETLTSIPQHKVIGKNVEDVFPFMKQSGLDTQLMDAYLQQTFFEKDIEFPLNQKVKYFKIRFIPVEKGVQVSITDFTTLYNKQEELEKINEELYIRNQVFHEAEEAANLGSYTWYMREDKTIMSDNVFRILGFEPQSFEMSALVFRDLAHPNDVQLYDDSVKNALENNIPIEFTFRVITNDKKTKYLYTKGDFGEREGNRVMVGIIQDVTKRFLNEKTLKEQNIELIRNNQELESFNRIASHDLQEPLRKIQMFISRVNQTEKENLSEKGLTYFSKIENAASRSRNLINNLLAFSRIDNKDFSFEYTKLEEVFESVLETFSIPIEEYDIEISKDSLPDLYAVPFLMEQLFTNLVGNAIKYRDTNKKSKIIIEANRVHSNQIPQEFIKTHKYYHSIKIIDNGIGFEQQQSDKIFQLFQRLHGKDEYSGTGIGLAICKKIVLKHHGHIYTSSVLGKGSIFTVYLPSGKIKVI